MKNVTTFALTAALIAGVSASAFAGTITETSATWKAGFSLDDSTHTYSRTVNVDHDTSYKSGSARVVKSTISSTKVPGSFLTENGYELVQVVFDPSQIATASNDQNDAQPAVLDHWQAGYSLDDDGRYYLNK